MEVIRFLEVNGFALDLSDKDLIDISLSDANLDLLVIDISSFPVSIILVSKTS